MKERKKEKEKEECVHQTHDEMEESEELTKPSSKSLIGLHGTVQSYVDILISVPALIQTRLSENSHDPNLLLNINLRFSAPWYIVLCRLILKHKQTNKQTSSAVRFMIS